MRRSILIVFALLIGTSSVWAKDPHSNADKGKPHGHETARQMGMRLCMEKAPLTSRSCFRVSALTLCCPFRVCKPMVSFAISTP
jgi:hypothetical protein